MAAWDENRNIAAAEELPPPIVAAEPMQIAFLDGLYAEKEGLDVVFHGGTSIRMLYGGHRYSEDLDFCIPDGMAGERLDSLVQRAYRHAKELITLYLGEAAIELKKKEGRRKIATWWLNALPAGERRKYKVKIEFGTYPAYSRQTIPLRIRNRSMPRQPLVVSMSAEELLADKISALADRPYTKERDFFDIWYLTTALNIGIDLQLLRRKLRDYHVGDPSGVLRQRLGEMSAARIAENMELFLPARYRRLLSANNYREVVEACRATMHLALEHLEGR